MKIESEEMFLLFDMRTETKINLSNSKPRGDFKWITVEGEFITGEVFEATMNFDLIKNEKRNTIYEIDVTDEGVKFEELDKTRLKKTVY